MKKILQKVANRCGFRIIRFSGPTPRENALEAMHRLLAGTEEPIIFDVGAHHGHVSKAFRGLFPKAVIYAFEPFEESFAQLQANTSSDPRIRVFNFGLSDKNGVQSFNSNSSSATNSLLPTDQSGAQIWGRGLLETQKVVQAQFKTLDSVVATLRIPRIDILKLDVQGAEHLVIEGATATCNQCMIRLIYAEIITQPTYRGQKRLDEALSVFYNNGFDLFNIYNMSYTSEGKLLQVDSLFTKTVR